MSSDETVWFPLDNAPSLIQEIVHETQAQWVIHGTPASGVGITGLVHLNVPVVAMVNSASHAEWLRKCLLQRAIEDLCTPGTSLSIPRFVKRTQELLGVTTKTSGESDEEHVAKKLKIEETPKKEGKDKKDSKDKKEGQKHEKDRKDGKSSKTPKKDSKDNKSKKG